METNVSIYELNILRQLLKIPTVLVRSQCVEEVRKANMKLKSEVMYIF